MTGGAAAFAAFGELCDLLCRFPVKISTGANFLLDKFQFFVIIINAVIERDAMERWLSWSKAHDWKSCIPLKGIKGSNPFLSAMKAPEANAFRGFLFLPGANKQGNFAKRCDKLPDL